QPEIPASDSLSKPVADLACDGEVLLVELDGAAGLAEVRVGVAEAPRGVSFPAPVADLACNGEVLLVELVGAAGLAESRVGEAEVAHGDSLSAPVADLACNAELLLVELDGAAGLAEGCVGEAEVARGVSLSAPVADLAGNGEVLLVVLDGAAGFAEVRVVEAEVAERVAFPASVAELPRRGQGDAEPPDSLRGAETEIEAIGPGMGVPKTELGRGLIAGNVVRGPGLARSDVGPLEVKQPQAAQQVRASPEIEVIGPCQNGSVMHRVPALRLCALFGAATAVREDPREVVEAVPAIVTVHQAPSDQVPEGRFRRFQLQSPDRSRRGGVEGGWKDGQGAKAIRRFFRQEIVGEAQRGVDQPQAGLPAGQPFGIDGRGEVGAFRESAGRLAEGEGYAGTDRGEAGRLIADARGDAEEEGAGLLGLHLVQVVDLQAGQMKEEP